jgi:chromosomal replication initiator protein
MMEPISEAVWGDILGHVRAHHPSIARGWFGQLSGGGLDGGELTIHARNRPQYEYLESLCVRPFIEAAQAATGRLVSVRFLLAEDGEPAAAALPEDAAIPLNADNVFDHFVVGPCNRLAHASCVAASESPGTAYNPLFVHGSAGLGKTHLLQAVCHRILLRQPGARVVYLSCETFVNQFIEAVEQGAMEGFRYRHRQADILVIDDIQFLSGRERTQEEFFHTFNTLYQVRRQIIVSADCPPSEIPSLEERLVSRFNWGMVARIDPPCLETRIAIIRKKMGLRGVDLPEDVVLFIATRIQSNTRELEGALNRLHALASLERRPVDMALARLGLSETEPAAPKAIRMNDIMGIVTERFDVKLSDLQGRRRNRSIALPRQLCMYLARQYTSHSLEEIGGFFGGRDHTTVLHANRLILAKREADARFRQRVEEIEEVLRRQ